MYPTIYTELDFEELLEDDQVSPQEMGFMLGFMAAS
jgi:hypothetical protein